MESITFECFIGKSARSRARFEFIRLVDEVNQKTPSGGANDRFIGHPGLCSNPVRLNRLEGTDEMPPHLR